MDTSFNDSGYRSSYNNLDQSLAMSALSTNDERHIESNKLPTGTTPSKKSQEFRDSKKSPLKTGTKNALNYILTSVGRLSPKFSPVEKRLNFGSRVCFNPQSPPHSKDISTSTNILQSTPNPISSQNHTRQAKRILFPENNSLSSEKEPNSLPTEVHLKQKSVGVDNKTATRFGKWCEKTNTLFRIPLANSPKKNLRQSYCNRVVDDRLRKDKLMLKVSKMGDCYVDFITEFSKRGMEYLVIQYLSNEDLFSASLVSQNWYNSIQYELFSRQSIFEEKQKLYMSSLNSTEDNLENVSPSTRRSSIQSFSELDHHTERPERETVPQILNSSCNSSVIFKPSTIYNTSKSLPSSVEHRPWRNSGRISRMLQDERRTSLVNLTTSCDDKIVKCPSCMSLAKVTSVKDEGSCSNSLCQYRFCSLCDGPYHGSEPCKTKVTFDEFESPSKLGSMKSLDPTSNAASTNLCKSKSQSAMICGKKARASLRRL